MNNIYKKASGGMLSNGWYYLIFLIMAIGGFALTLAIPGSMAVGAVCMTVCVTGVFSLIGAPIEKYKYSETKAVRLDSGEEVKITLVKKRKHIMSILDINFMGVHILNFSLLYYIPIGTQYFIISNLDRVDNSAGKFICGQFENLSEYFNCEQITKGTYKALMSKPQLCKDVLQERLASQKKVFFNFIEKYEKRNLLEREMCTETYAVYKLSDELAEKFCNGKPDENNLRIKFNYTGTDSYQNGFFAFKNLLDKGYSYEKQFAFEAAVADESECVERYVQLNNDVFTKFIISKESSNLNDNKYIDIDSLDEIKDTDSRDILTPEIVSNVARHKRKSGYILIAILAYYFGLPFVIVGIGALFTLNLLGIVMCAIVGGTLIYVAEHFRRKNKAIRRKPSIDEIDIVKVVCLEKGTKIIDGRDVFYYRLSNGIEITETDYKYDLQPNTACYIVYRKPENEMKWVYSSMKVKLSPELNVIDRTQK